MGTQDTPMIQQYRAIKEEYGDTILFFRLGDFYEMFFEQAEEVSSLLNLTLTERNGIPMCGIPHHAKQNYVARLLQYGKKIAICEQVTAPTMGKIVQREVVEVITPGTVTEEDFLDSSKNNYIAAISREHTTVSYAYIDISTGDFTVSPFPWDSHGEGVRRELLRTSPREILVDQSLLEDEEILDQILSGREGLLINKVPQWQFDVVDSEQRLKRLLGVQNLKAFQFDDHDPAIKSVGALLSYIESNAKNILSYITQVERREGSDFLQMDESTQRNLELINNLLNGGEKFTLFSTLKKTKTPMGSRLLSQWILNPLVHKEEIEKRQFAIEQLFSDINLLKITQKTLGGIHDLERLATRSALMKITPQELIKLMTSLLAAHQLESTILDVIPFFPKNIKSTEALMGIATLLQNAISDDLKNETIREGFNKELDSLRALRDNADSILQKYVESERQKTGITTIKLKHNRIIGYFLEVPKSGADKVPESYIRKQSMAQAERFTTEQLMSIETRAVEAQERAAELENTLFLDLKKLVAAEVDHLFTLAQRIAHYDTFQSLATVAMLYGYTKPTIRNHNKILIKKGRHPVVESSMAPGSFVANDTTFQDQYRRFALITGPNMAGKSTYLRQTALIILMAQMGSFVPAESAEIGISDQIFCRVGATDNLTRGESTFLVEMNETAYILRNATAHSLVIMDEVGRGTGTTDGLSIAWAVSEYLLKIGAKTLFATHFLEIAQLESPLIVLLHLLVSRQGQQITFLNRVEEGIAEGSYGIEVAKLAGIPKSVIQRANYIMKRLESQQHTVHTSENPLQHSLDLLGDSHEEPNCNQEELISMIEEQDITKTTPVEALLLLEKLQSMIKQ